MSSIWSRLVKASPLLDCGLCGFPKCASFTRAALVGRVTLERCPILSLSEFSGLKSEQEGLILRKTGLRYREALERPEGGVLLTRPCKDTDQKVMAELRVYNGVSVGEQVLYGTFDSILLCDYLDCLSSIFEIVKCSRDLGYGRADTGEMSITLMQDGRINMRRVDDRESVLRVFAKIEAAILGSTICNCCGNDLVSIVSNLCDASENHPALSAGSSICVDRETLQFPLTKTLFLAEFKSEDIADSIDYAFSYIEDSIQNLISANLSNSEKHINMSEIQCKLIGEVVNSSSNKRATLMLKTLGTLWVISSALEAVAVIEGLLRPYRNSHADSARELIASMYYDRDYAIPPSTNEFLFQIYANTLRFLRARNKQLEWNS
ncbi:MAG: (Fe-S)-binding protein [Candidatus Thorarchaeota archaeon]